MQRRPIKRLARVDFAARRNIAMAENIARVETVSPHNVFQQRHQRLHLRLGESRHRAANMPVIIQLNADRGGIHIRLTPPIRDTRMPSAVGFINQLERLPVAANEIMRRDFGLRVAQPCQCGIAIAHIGIVQNNMADGIWLTDGRARIEIGRQDLNNRVHNTAPAFRTSGFLRPIISTPKSVKPPPSQKRRLKSSPQNITPKTMPKIGAISVSGAVTETS